MSFSSLVNAAFDLAVADATSVEAAPDGAERGGPTRTYNLRCSSSEIFEVYAHIMCLWRLDGAVAQRRTSWRSVEMVPTGVGRATLGGCPSPTTWSAEDPRSASCTP